MDIVQTIRDAAARIRAEFDHPNAPATDADDLEKIADQIASITQKDLDMLTYAAEALSNEINQADDDAAHTLNTLREKLIWFLPPYTTD